MQTRFDWPRTAACLERITLWSSGRIPKTLRDKNIHLARTMRRYETISPDHDHHLHQKICRPKTVMDDVIFLSSLFPAGRR
jgi:hypothetical protein